MIDAIVVMTTTGSRDEADKIAGELVERNLAACAQVVGPIRSVFRWEGVVEHKQEWLCLLKSARQFYPQLEAALRELHSYDVPEVIALPVVDGCSDYLHWIHASLAAGADTS